MCKLGQGLSPGLPEVPAAGGGATRERLCELYKLLWVSDSIRLQAMISSGSTRDRRGAMFGPGPNQRGHGDIDLEALETENDRNIAALGERVGLLRNITSGIHSEVNTQNTLLDNMSQGFAGIQMGLGATVGKFKRVMNEPHGRKTVFTAGGLAVLIFLLYIWWR